MNLKLAIFVAICLGAAASPASAQVSVNSLSLPATIPDPSAGFDVTYRLFGSQFGSATVQVNFYLSQTSNGSSGVALLKSDQVLLRGSGAGPYSSPLGTQTISMASSNLTPAAQALLASISNGCATQRLFLLADINGGFTTSSQASTMGTTKLPDFVFTGGTISSTVIVPGGTTSISFDLFTRCPASTASRVGIFLTDTAFNPLAFIGAVSISAGAGTSSLPPTPITFSPTIPTGPYEILLVADVDGVIGESNETNNGGSFPLNVVPAARAAAQRPASLNQAVPLRDDLGAELEGLERDPPADYVTRELRGPTRLH